MQVMLMRSMSKGEYVIVPKGTKFTGAGKLGLKLYNILIQTLGSEMSTLSCYMSQCWNKEADKH